MKAVADGRCTAKPAMTRGCGVFATCCAVLVSAVAPAWADPVDRAAIAATFAKERAACTDGSSQQERGACLREAGASRDQALRGGLPTASAQVLRENAQRRCQVQPAGEPRALCERMATGEGRTTGTVAAGGALHELTTVVREAPKP